jgi:hypothetical protein
MELFIVILIFLCASSGQDRKFFLQTPKSKIDKNHSYAIFRYKNNNHIFYDYSEINQKGPPVRKSWLK